MSIRTGLNGHPISCCLTVSRTNGENTAFSPQDGKSNDDWKKSVLRLINEQKTTAALSAKDADIYPAFADSPINYDSLSFSKEQPGSYYTVQAWDVKKGSSRVSSKSTIELKQNNLQNQRTIWPSARAKNNFLPSGELWFR